MRVTGLERRDRGTQHVAAARRQSAARSGATARPRPLRRAGRAVGPWYSDRPRVDQHQPVAHLLELAEVVRRHQHGAAGAGQAADERRASRARPAGRGRWPARRGSAARVAEQRGGDAEPLLHAERVACGSGRRRGRRARRSSRARDRRRVVPRRRWRTCARFSAPDQRRVEGRALDQRARPGAGTRPDRRCGSPSTRAGAGAWGERGRAASPWWWSCRRRSGRRSRRRRPRAARCRGVDGGAVAVALGQAGDGHG